MAVIAMIAFHFTWDLGFFQLIDYDISFTPEGRVLSHLIAGTFLFLVGVSLTLAHRKELNARAFLRRLFKIAGAAALVSLGAFALAWIVVRGRTRARFVIDAISSAPLVFPGIVLGFAVLQQFLALRWLPIYGTHWILVFAFLIRFMPYGLRFNTTSMLQIHKELEEAAWICGRGLLGTIGTIVLPLARPGVVASMTLIFVLAIRELGSSLFLYTSDTTVMAVLLLDYYEGGNTGKTAAFSLVQTGILAVLLGLTNWLSRGAAQSSARTG